MNFDLFNWFQRLLNDHLYYLELFAFQVMSSTKSQNQQDRVMLALHFNEKKSYKASVKIPRVVIVQKMNLDLTMTVRLEL